jgi:LPS export ABC transporter permease LptG
MQTDPNPSSKPVARPAPVRQVRWWSPALEWLQTVPFLGLVLALVGFGVFFMVTLRDAQAIFQDTPAEWAKQYRYGLLSEARSDLLWHFFTDHAWLALGCLAPALLLSFIRMRGMRLMLPITLLTVGGLIWWLFYELSINLNAARTTGMGEEPAPDAFFGKLAIIGAGILSFPVLCWLYLRSTTLDRYVLRNFMLPLMLCLVGMISIMVISDLLNNANEFIRAGFTPGKVVLFYLAQIPQLLVQILDIAVLLAVLFTLSRMSRFNEIISMLGSGTSLMRILTPLFVAGLWITLCAVAMNYSWAPAAQNMKDAMLREAEGGAETIPGKSSKKLKNVTNNLVFRSEENNRTWYVFEMPNSIAQGEKLTFLVVIQDDGDGNYQKAYYAKRAVWLSAFREWRFFDGTIVDLTVAGQDSDPEIFEKLTLNDWPETPWALLSNRINPEYLGVQELVSYLRTNSNQGPERLAKYETTLWARFSLPIRCFLLVLIAAPLGIVTGRRGLLAGVANSILVFVLAYFSHSILTKSAENSSFAPWIGAWGTNLVLLAFGCLLLWARNYNRQLPSLNPLKWFRA